MTFGEKTDLSELRKQARRLGIHSTLGKSANEIRRMIATKSKPGGVDARIDPKAAAKAKAELGLGLGKKPGLGAAKPGLGLGAGAPKKKLGPGGLGMARKPGPGLKKPGKPVSPPNKDGRLRPEHEFPAKAAVPPGERLMADPPDGYAAGNPVTGPAVKDSFVDLQYRVARIEAALIKANLLDVNEKPTELTFRPSESVDEAKNPMDFVKEDGSIEVTENDIALMTWEELNLFNEYLQERLGESADLVPELEEREREARVLVCHVLRKHGVFSVEKKGDQNPKPVTALVPAGRPIPFPPTEPGHKCMALDDDSGKWFVGTFIEFTYDDDDVDKREPYLKLEIDGEMEVAGKMSSVVWHAEYPSSSIGTALKPLTANLVNAAA